MISIEGVSRQFVSGDSAVKVLDGLDFSLERGEVAVVRGPSGSGKSTFLSVLGLVDKPTTGTYKFQGNDVTGMAISQVDRLRMNSVGIVFQNFNLVASLSALENVALPFYLGRVSVDYTRCRELFRMVGLAGYEARRINELSGGQQQRVAIARALVRKPSLLIADEPTANLDMSTSRRMFSLLDQARVETKCALIIATHEVDVPIRNGKFYSLTDGKLIGR